MRPCYADYVKHSLRFFLRHRNDTPTPIPQAEAYKANWHACAEAFGTLSPYDQSMIETVYTAGESLTASVTAYADDHGVSVDYVWGKINKLERCIAKLRGLI